MSTPEKAAAALVTLTLVWLAPPAALSQDGPPPWQRTETRADCDEFDILKNPYFGDTHIHTAYSSDAVIAGTVGGPREAYDFALGQPIDLPPFPSTRSAQLRRPLDFVAISDHSEQLGEIQICLVPGLDPDGYADQICVDVRDQIAPPFQESPAALPPLAFINLLVPYQTAAAPARFAWCGVDGADCLAQTSIVWQDIQDAADEFYDRSAACTFTSFVAYEWTATPGLLNLHRNVIFRNDAVPSLPISYIEEQTAEGLHLALESECTNAGTGCDLVAIPHNSALSGGLMFQPLNADGSPMTAADAALRARMEPVIELTQHKGDSECRPGVNTTDELCGYEKSDKLTLYGASNPANVFAPLSFVREAFKEGLVQEQAIGVNPFQAGVIGSTDTHNATPGFTHEGDFRTAGHIGLADRNPEWILTLFPPGGIEANPGGLAVAWAEENSRDAIFTAMRRREVYATSGTRPIVRFFAGNYKKSLCDRPDFVEQGYAGGVPMGAEHGALRKSKSPRFAVMATKDPGPPGEPGTQLQRIQIIKGWVDAGGQAHEKVFEVAGDADSTATVDTDTCATSGSGFDALCAVWEDPEFDPGQRAFYYARVLENPTCRWSTLLCNDLEVDCDDPGSVPAEYAQCCSAEIPLTIQERAWTSPTWYRPDGIGRLKATVKYGSSVGEDTLKLKASFAAVTEELDPNTTPISVGLSDDDEIFDATIPAGAMDEKKPGAKYVLNDPSGSLGGLRTVKLKVNAKGEGKLVLKTVALDLAAGADRSTHTVDARLSTGSYEAVQGRLWRYDGRTLRVK